MLDPAMMAGAGPEQFMQAGPPPEMMGGFPPEAPPASASAAELLKQILSLAEEYRSQEQSEQNLLLVEQARTLFQKILANEEKEADGLLQGKMSPRAVRSAVGGSY